MFYIKSTFILLFLISFSFKTFFSVKFFFQFTRDSRMLRAF